MILALILSLVFAQTPAPAASPSIDEKSQQIINSAIEALGGQRYLNIQTELGKGYYTTYSDGISQIPSRFLDYLAYPDRERTEFTAHGIRSIQTNVGNTGWLFDGAVKKITDQSPAQVEDFKLAMRTRFENLLRGWWKNEGGKVTYVGRREAGLAKRNETVKLTYPNGFWIEFEFGARDFLPAKIIYKRTRKDPDTGDEVEVTEEDRIMRFVPNDGVNAQWIIDRYVNGKQSSRINYETVQYNQVFADALFAKPHDVKAIK